MCCCKFCQLLKAKRRGNLIFYCFLIVYTHPRMHRELGSSGLVTFFMQKIQFIYKKNTTPLLGQNNSILINNYFDYLDSHNPTIVFF